MIKFNESRITSDGQKLIISVAVDNRTFFDNIFIDTIIIDSQDTFTGFGPSNTPLYTWKDLNPLIVNGNPVQKKYLRLELDAKDLDLPSLQSSLFYVYVITDGDFKSNTPCELEDKLFTRVVIDYGPIYRETINYIKEISEDCEIPQKFIDRILKVNALELSIMAGHYTLANGYWNKFFKKQANRLRQDKCC